MRADNERNNKEKESAARASLETEIGRLKGLLDKEKKRADVETKKAETEKKNANEMKEMLKSEQSRANDLSSSKSEDKSLEAEIGRLKELLDKEKKRADIETRKAETEKKNTNRLKEMWKSQESRANEQKKLVDVERKKAEEFAHQLQKLKREADEAKSKLQDPNNKNIQLERKKTTKDKRKDEEQRKIAEMSTKHALEEKQRADMFKQQALSEKVRADKLAKELEDAKQKTTKELTNPSVAQKAISAKMELLKKRLKLEKERVKYADNVAELEKKSKKVVEEELCQIKLEFALFLGHIGLCDCSSQGICRLSDSKENSNIQLSSEANNNGRSPLRVRNKDGNSKKRKRLVNTEGETGHAKIAKTASALLGYIGNMDKPSTEGTQLSGMSIEKNGELGIRTVGDEDIDYNATNQDDVFKGLFDGDCVKLPNLVNEVDDEMYQWPGNEDLGVSNRIFDAGGILNLDNEVDNEMYQWPGNEDLGVSNGIFDAKWTEEEAMYLASVQRSLSPTLPAVKFQSSQCELDDSRPFEVTCNMSTVNTSGDSLEILGNGESGNTIIALMPCARSEDQDSIAVTGNSDLGHTGTKTSSGNEPGSEPCHYIVVFPEIKAGGSLSKIIHTTKTFTTQCCAFS